MSLSGWYCRKAGNLCNHAIFSLDINLLQCIGACFRSCRPGTISPDWSSHSIRNLSCDTSWRQPKCKYRVIIVKCCRSGIPTSFKTALGDSQASIPRTIPALRRVPCHKSYLEYRQLLREKKNPNTELLGMLDPIRGGLLNSHCDSLDCR